MSLRKNRVHTQEGKLPRHALAPCWACGKLCFSSRKEARRQAALLPRQEGDVHRARAYQCWKSGEWHVGHLPVDVIRGEVSREQVRENMRKRDEERDRGE